MKEVQVKKAMSHDHLVAQGSAVQHESPTLVSFPSLILTVCMVAKKYGDRSEDELSVMIHGGHQGIPIPGQCETDGLILGR